MSEFIQSGPVLVKNQFDDDLLLQDYLAHQVPADIRGSIGPDLSRLGKYVIGEMLEFYDDVNRHPPELIQFSPWGQRIDEIRVSRGWTELHAAAAGNGIVASAYERKEGEFSRLHQAIRLYLFHPSSAFYSCPLAMTDGAARCIELIGDEQLKSEVFPKLISRDPKVMWTSGQWMTERPGGSDVGRTETVAKKEGESYRLYGTKWFTSATTSQMAMTLARIEGAPEGSRGLSLFFAPIHDRQEFSRVAEVLRLKDKLGTKALPTAEIRMNGLSAQIVGEPNMGVKNISALLNVTRYYNSVCSISAVRRLFALALDYSHRREAFGQKLIDHRLHVETLANIQLELAVGTHLTFHVAKLMGKEETGLASEEDSAVLRLLTPLVKLYTGKMAMSLTSELLECFGGAGYIEDTGLPLFLRDAQVFSLWEGTTNILSLDCLRAIGREGALEPFLQVTLQRAKQSHGHFPKQSEQLQMAIKDLAAAFQRDPSDLNPVARDIAISLARVFVGGLLLEHGQSSELGRILATRFFFGELVSRIHMSDEYHSESSALAGL